jgi:hypothetical protein
LNLKEGEELFFISAFQSFLELGCILEKPKAIKSTNNTVDFYLTFLFLEGSPIVPD